MHTMDSAPAATHPPARPSLRAWMRDHDDKWLFVVAYLGLSIVLSIFISLFWLLVVIGLHFILEWVRQAHAWQRRRDVALHALWEVKLDIGLALLAFMVVLYIDVILGVLGIQSAARVAAATRIGARAAAWERNLRTFLLTVDEMARISHAAYMLGIRRHRGTGDAGPAVPAMAPVPVSPAGTPAWRGRWGWGDRIGLTLVAAGTLLILLAPVLTPHDWSSAASRILEQLRPFPS
jgi:hypothetical protein